MSNNSKRLVPKLRFPEFRDSGTWEKKPINKSLTIGSGKTYKHLSNGDIPVYGSGGYMLSVDAHLYDGESACIFIYLSFKNIYWLNHNEAGGIPSLSKITIGKIEIPTPLLPEQKKIANGLSSLDELISTHTQKLDTLKTHKKGLLQQLFPSADEVNG